MKKIITFLAVCAMALCATSCFKQTPRLTIEPSSVSLKVGESVQLHPGMEGEADDLVFADVMRINPADGVCFLDDLYILTALKPGTTRVGVAILVDKKDASKGYKYSAYTTVTVTE